jgi:hypothetical protein
MKAIEVFFDRVAEQNKWCNEHGQIPQNEFINRWHDLDNNLVRQSIEGACDFMDEFKQKDPDLEAQIRTVWNYINANQDKHPNCANPSLKDEAVLKRKYHKSIMRTATTRSIKTEFFRMMMLMRDMYNRVSGIGIKNTDGDRGRYLPDWDGLNPNHPQNAFEKNFEEPQ